MTTHDGWSELADAQRRRKPQRRDVLGQYAGRRNPLEAVRQWLAMAALRGRVSRRMAARGRYVERVWRAPELRG
jgi:hypothetical protein